MNRFIDGKLGANKKCGNVCLPMWKLAENVDNSKKLSTFSTLICVSTLGRADLNVENVEILVCFVFQSVFTALKVASSAYYIFHEPVYRWQTWGKQKMWKRLFANVDNFFNNS